MAREIIISISPDGMRMRAIYDDRIKGLLKHGDGTITRASHVEPGNPSLGQDPEKWYADLSPSGGGVLGPFNTRAEALTEEVTWLDLNSLRKSA